MYDEDLDIFLINRLYQVLTGLDLISSLRYQEKTIEPLYTYFNEKPKMGNLWAFPLDFLKGKNKKVTNIKKNTAALQSESEYYVEEQVLMNFSLEISLYCSLLVDLE